MAVSAGYAGLAVSARFASLAVSAGFRVLPVSAGFAGFAVSAGFERVAVCEGFRLLAVSASGGSARYNDRWSGGRAVSACFCKINHARWSGGFALGGVGDERFLQDLWTGGPFLQRIALSGVQDF